MAYYPNLADNDADQLVGLFRHYVDNTMEVMKARCRSWWKHDGLFFAETSYWWGSYRPEDYGCDRHGVPDVENPYMYHHIEGGVELSQLMVRHWHYTQDEDVLQKYTIPWTFEVLKFYDLHFPRNPNGTLLMLNAKACESYNHCTNPAPQVAGLKMVVAGLLTVPEPLLGAARMGFLNNFSRQIPDVPLMESCQTEHSGCGERCGACASKRAPAGTTQIAPCLLNVSTVEEAKHAVGGYPVKVSATAEVLGLTRLESLSYVLHNQM
jgi:alpha-L-fucosidase 2|eukprot:COSAG01_NODE_1386_length_10508_cov_2.215850_11_plen_266_part_00